MLKKILLLSVLMTAAAGLRAQPEVTGVAGECVHGGALTVTGSGFGVKDPAGPLVWDDGASSPPLETYYDETLPTSAQQGDEYNMAYRAVPFRGLEGPNPRIAYILGGAHATDTSASMYASGNNVSIGRNLSSFQFFAQYWYRVDPLFDESNHPTMGENMKELCLSGAEGEIYGGEWGYYNWCNSHVPDANFTDPVKLGRLGADCPDLPYGCTDDERTVYHDSPVNGWIKMQWEGDYDETHDNPVVTFTTYPDGQVTRLDHYGNPITTFETIYGCGYPQAGGLRFLGIGGFARVPRTNNGVNSFRYFAGVYMDDTRARVMLGDDPDIASCSVLEPQIPSAWSDGSITVSVNLGELPDAGTAYLFVFDADNASNPTGFPVTFPCAAAEETAAETVDPAPDGLTDPAQDFAGDTLPPDVPTDTAVDAAPDPEAEGQDDGGDEGCGCSVVR